MYFKYEALSRKGARIDGILKALNEQAAMQILRERGYHPLRVEPAPAGSIPTKLEGDARPFRMEDLPLDEMSAKTDELIDGNDAAYGELLGIIDYTLGRLEAEPEICADDSLAKMVRATCDGTKAKLAELGSPEAAREHFLGIRRRREEAEQRAAAGDLEALANWTLKIGPGWLTSVASSQHERAYGEILLYRSHAIFFHKIKSEEKTAAKLCTPDHVKNFKLEGRREKILRIDMDDGPGWTFIYDWEKLGDSDRRGQLNIIKRFRFLTSESQDPSLLPKTPITESIPFIIIRGIIVESAKALWKYRYLAAVSFAWFWISLRLLVPVMDLPKNLWALIFMVVTGLPVACYYLWNVYRGRFRRNLGDAFAVIIMGGAFLNFVLIVVPGIMIFLIYRLGVWVVNLF